MEVIPVTYLIPGPLLRKFGSTEAEEEEFQLPSEYADSTEEEVSEFDPDAVYILPVIGEEHIFEKRKVGRQILCKFEMSDKFETKNQCFYH